MGIVNRRNIALSLAAWRLSRALRRLLHQPEPEPEPPKRRRAAKVGLVLAGALAAAGALAFWRTR
jgi:ferric-dicitrate binding protein FerR (iron transport regulator)